MNNTDGKPYLRFFVMLFLSFAAMYCTMYLNTYQWDHVYFSLTRFYMACMGIAAMAIIMWLCMQSMYRDRTKNSIIILGSVVIFISALLLVRNQKPIDDVTYMKAMIPHHSIAILTSERAAINDPEVRELANEIIKTQKKEIAEMKRYIRRLEMENDKNQ